MSLKKKKGGIGFEELVYRTKPGGMKVGFVRGLGEHPNTDSGATVAEIAAYNEFGTQSPKGNAHIPERPFLRTTIREQTKPVYIPLVKDLLAKMLLGQMKVAKAIGILGLKAVADVQAKIDAITSPENADYTKDKKGSSNPLIDTGHMRKSVTWERVE